MCTVQAADLFNRHAVASQRLTTAIRMVQNRNVRVLLSDIQMWLSCEDRDKTEPVVRALLGIG